MRIAIIALLLLTSCTTKPVTVHDDITNRQCPATILDDGGHGWTDQDSRQADISRRRCRDLYGPDSCLRKLRKVGIMRYVAICRSL